MQPFIFFLVAAYLAGVTQMGRPVRERPLVLLVFSVLAAASFYSLRVIL